MAEESPATDHRHGESVDSKIDQRTALTYWQDANADVDGMLGGVTTVSGFSQVSRVDLQGSRSFLAKLGIGAKNGRRKVSNILEGGAGVGRVTEGLLLGVGESVDIIEPIAKFTFHLQGKDGIRSIFNVGLEGWKAAEGTRYDLIWTQWCLGHLTDAQLIKYLEQCKAVLSNEQALIIVKENMSTSGADHFDATDSSVTREDSKYRQLFDQAGLRIVRREMQKALPAHLPQRLFPVQMYALRPDVVPKLIST
ncbi:DUF858 domain-containing protein [Xylariaceae sp. FL0016]|nr:DUF858 domain-containing protein [Xylariaceae sp. FL0016]